MIDKLLTPLELVYLAGLRAKNALERRHAPRRLSWPVVSVGNLSVGGAGKTPLTIALIRLLSARGWNVDVLSHGYRRQIPPGAPEIEQVDPEGSAIRFGDEPLMTARLTGAPVFVGSNRYGAGLAAEQLSPDQARGVHLVDDGFQHRRLARDLDIVVFDRRDLSDSLLPRGRLREPLTALARAGAVVLQTKDADLVERIQPFLRPGTSLWLTERKLTLPSDLGEVAAFSAIARPDEFYKSLEARGVCIVARRSFRDHHFYTRQEIEGIGRLGKNAHCTHFITTEKDAVKLDTVMKTSLESIAPLTVAALAVTFEDEARVAEDLAAALKRVGCEP